jgi:GT2 family glycosyltransferase/serine acetyltransferase
MKIAGIIINYRTAEMSARAADALLVELEKAGTCHLYLVDNDSGDGSLAHLQQEAVRRNWGDRVSVIAAPRNGGYGYGINLAIERSLANEDLPEYFYVLNSDAFADEGSVVRLVEFMDDNPDAGLAGSHVHGPDGTSQGAAFRFPSVYSELESTAGIGALSRMLSEYIVSLPAPTEDRSIDWVPGTSMILRRHAIDQVGLFDEAFFLYFEEVDYCRRLQRAGWKCFYVADAPITHIGCVSTGMLDHERRMPRYWFESRHRYFMKHHGRAYTAVSDAAWIAGHVVGGVKRRLIGRGVASRPHMLTDFITASLRDLPLKRRPRPDEARVEPKNADGKPSLAPPADTRAVETMSLRELIAEDVGTYERDLLSPGLWAMLAHRVGRRAATMPSGPAQAALEGTYQVLFTAVDWVWGIHLPKSVRVGRRVRLWHNGCMLLTAREIGNDVHIRHDTTFGPVRGREPGARPVIEDRADIGSGVCVLGEVTVGHDATVGANSVVMKNVPPKAMVLGVPARIVPS